MNKYKKKKLIALSITFFILASVLGFFLLEKYDPEKKSVITLEQSDLEKENIEAEIVDGSENQQAEETEEKNLENDAENLAINEESEEESVESEDLKPAEKNLSALPLPLKNNTDPNVLKIGFMTDLHVRSAYNQGNSLEKYYSNKINYFVEKMNNVFCPNFILLNGDVIEGTRTPSDIGTKELALTRNIFARTTIQKYWVIGNHDLRSISKNQWKQTLGIDYLSKSFNIGNYKIIILDSNFTKDDSNVSPGNDYTRGKVSQKEIDWLKNELEKTKKKVIVFVHHPQLKDVKVEANINLPYNARELQEIFSEYGVLAVFSGHIEDLYYQEIGGVSYFVSPGMVKHPKYPGAFSEITIKKNKISIVLNYLVGNEYRRVEIEKE